MSTNTSVDPLPAGIRTPAFVIESAKLDQNLRCLAAIKQRSGAHVLFATKAFSAYSFFPRLSEYLDGTTASGLYEARLGKEYFGKEVHVYSPGYSDEEFDALMEYADHICFNSPGQIARYLHEAKRRGKQVGVRINPDLSQVDYPRYDPCSPLSRFGVAPTDLDMLPWSELDFIHIHALSDSMAAASVRLIQHVDVRFESYIRRVGTVNFGGGHYMTHPDYDRDAFIAAIQAFREKYRVNVVLEPGASVVLDAGFMTTTVLDVLRNPSGRHMAIVDTSAACHMIDILDIPYQPIIRGAGRSGEKKYEYTLGGKTCLSGDIIGTFSFDSPLVPGTRLILEDMLQYNLVKGNFFNGVFRPDLAELHADGRYEVHGRFGYADFNNFLMGHRP